MYLLFYSICIYLFFYSCYWFLLTLCGIKPLKQTTTISDSSNPEIVIVLPAYKPSQLFYRVLDSVQIAIHNRNIKVYVLLQEVNDIDLKNYILSKGFYVEEKTFSEEVGNVYQQALKHIANTLSEKRKQGYWKPEFIMLVDKDNILRPTYFDLIPTWLYDQYEIIQGRRRAIQTRNEISFFDSVSESLNDLLFRRAKMTLKCMIEISGSGALIETDLFIKTINLLDPHAPGFDKNFMVNLLLLKREVRTIYWPASELIEEKTFNLNAHNPQRVRWFGEQYYNAFYKGIDLIKATIINRRLPAVEYLITLWRPPRSVQIIITPILSILELIWYYYTNKWYFGVPLLTISCMLVILSVFLFLITEKILLQSLKYSLKLPSIAFHNFFNAIKSIKKENRGKFIHTIHRL